MNGVYLIMLIWIVSDERSKENLWNLVLDLFCIKSLSCFWLYMFQISAAKGKSTAELTRIISAKLHKQLLEDVCILGEEPSVGLGKHLVHRLLRQVYKLSEELCGKRERQRLDGNLSPNTSAGSRQLTGTVTSDPAQIKKNLQGSYAVSHSLRVLQWFIMYII